jgi:hypothetical protein
MPKALADVVPPGVLKEALMGFLAAFAISK